LNERRDTLFRITEVPGSNTDFDSCYRSEIFRGLLQSLQENAGIILKRTRPLPFMSF